MRRVSCVFFLILMICSCSSTPERERLEIDEHQSEITQFLYASLRFRRPPGAAADPKVSPGGKDYFGAKTEGLEFKFDCQKADEKFFGVRIDKLKKCFSEISQSALKKEIEVEYRFNRDVVPSWELKIREDTPNCLKEELPEIKLPREIVYQAHVNRLVNDEERNHPFEPVNCYISHFDTQSGKILNLRTPIIGEKKVILKFPIQGDPLEVLQSYAITPFIEQGHLDGKLFPSSLCRRCIDQDEMILERDALKVRVWNLESVEQ